MHWPKKSMLVLLVLFSMCFCQQKTNKDFSSGETIKELEPIALILVEAVLNKQLDKIASFIPNDPEFRNGNFSSYAYKSLYGSAHSDNSSKKTKCVYDILVNIKELTLRYERIIYPEDCPYGKAVAFRVYFFDPKRIDLKLPLTEEQGQLWMEDYVTCIFIKQDSKWIIPSLFEFETDGPWHEEIG